MADERVRVVVSGQVQGVFFRVATRDVAERLHLTGWVRNRADGRVEAEFQGAPAAVERALEFCRRGPRQAHVSAVDVERVDPVPGEQRFEVR
ncbi:MAG: acylphosphatase [Pseudonocardiaceae bacterium]